jgi:hypothetical protein
MKEQCLLEIGYGIDVEEFDGKEVTWERFIYRADVVSIPAGNHSLEVYYHHDYYYDYDKWGGSRHDYVAGFKTVRYDFKPGYTYSIAIWGASDVRITEEKAGKPRSAVAVPEQQGYGIGMPFSSLTTGWGAVLAGQLGSVIDGDALTFGLYWDYGFGVGVPVGDSLPLVTYTGVSSEFYPPGKPYGLGIGAGVTSDTAFIVSLSPYIRATVIPYKRLTKLKLYFEYYLSEIEYGGGSDWTTNPWGMGINWFW